VPQLAQLVVVVGAERGLAMPHEVQGSHAPILARRPRPAPSRARLDYARKRRVPARRRSSAGSDRAFRNKKEIAMARYGRKSHEKVEETMHEFKRGQLKSSSGRKVTNPKQAVAIGLSEARSEGGKVPPAKKAAGKKTTAKRATAKKTTAKKTTAKKAPAKKAAAKKSTARKATARKTPAKKATAKKTTARKTTVKKTAAKKSTARKTGAKKTTVKKTGARKTAAKKSS
jgi:hypothetical protein